mmetsp:Transcript_18229/g.30243  ORF Transcript_18229/g.30243 Transcript_18229/m.30243 type:complete len:351 (+) Transcript_18229:67-1119(+)|eukprot:CAMPEP_0119005052 /NCGR_PEP_ID=MMETSP1176-20130426/1500_1 /TAXON_ID=265551 /ORGANISM="Synedropsis recta cf, Strain CCMP1620" /LENGTH=350 /DNA_ID=CAMNT_0006956817 /DNA_START=63 /DNA_END=1118 /DNA_ORIENTATION=+
MSLFTAVPGLVGGAFIGLAASTLLIVNGDVMGSSGITAPMVIQPRRTWKLQSWKFVYTSSFLAAANLYQLLLEPEALQIESPNLSSSGLLLAGLLVGFGTKLGNGCTSGHGICGLARFSKRSFAAVGTFMAVAMSTATLLSQEAVKNALQMLYNNADSSVVVPNTDTTMALLVAAIPTALALWSCLRKSSRKAIGAAVSGALFAVGLGISKMIWPSKVHGFLNVSAIPQGTYDPTLMAVMASGVVLSFLGYQMKNRLSKPVCGEAAFCVPANTTIDSNLLLGASCFGMGWGLGGFCPGPALFWAASGSAAVIYYWLPAYFAGSYLALQYVDYQYSCNFYSSNDSTKTRDN